VKQTLRERLRVVHQGHRGEPRFARNAVFFPVGFSDAHDLPFQLVLFFALGTSDAC
jgi:hypothetical protein|tara:strand:- start:303 stop:470 length:168 start_codon:yes stop_codon:yes gene_type:complete